MSDADKTTVRINLLLIRWHRPRSPKLKVQKATKHEWSVVKGDCLAPWIIDGDAICMALGRDAHDGEFVLIDGRYVVRTPHLFSAFTEPKIITKRSVKQLAIDADGHRWLVAADGLIKQGPHTIVGRLIATHRPPFWSLRRWRYPMRKAAWPARSA